MKTIYKTLAIVLLGAAVTVACSQREGSAPGAAHTTPSPAAVAALDRATALERSGNQDGALAAGYEAVEADPDFLAAHDWVIGYGERLFGSMDEEEMRSRLDALKQVIDAKYEEWRKRFPNSVGVLYGRAKTLYSRSSPEAEPLLLELVKRDPNLVEAYEMLAADAGLRGDEAAELEHRRKVATLKPDDANYALSYAMSAPRAERQAALHDVLKRFPKTDVAGEALLRLSDDATDDASRIRYLEQWRNISEPTSGGDQDVMDRLFEVYLRAEPEKALALAEDTQKRRDPGDEDEDDSQGWADRAELARACIEAKQKLAAGNAEQAVPLLSALEPERSPENAAFIEQLKVQILVRAGQTQAAYDSLIARQAKAPDDATLVMLATIGQQLNKTPAQVQADVKAAIYARAKPAPGFDLKEYASDKAVSLADLRGKVVLLTFWFPRCGWCIREFPHLETVLKKVRQQHAHDIAYVGINIVPEEDAFVMPRVRNSGYTFTPLKGTEEVVDAKKGYGVEAVPANFIIDRSGKIVYSDFMIDGPQEVMLERMLESVL